MTRPRVVLATGNREKLAELTRILVQFLRVDAGH